MLTLGPEKLHKIASTQASRKGIDSGDFSPLCLTHFLLP
jgi:hypothetical protein